MFFWENERHKYDLYISQYVIDECSFGDAEVAVRRLDFIRNIPIIPRSEQVAALAHDYQQLLNIPDKAKTDCFHLAACVNSEIDYLLSWNFKHLGIHTFVKLRDYNEMRGLFTPIMITPETLLEINEAEELS